uniref:Uncharacterized protein n=1 Tax=Oryza barthii TaxID=65489 RepID=A0A0D3H6P9_9ORYZ
AAAPPQVSSAGVGGGVWRGGARTAVAAVGGSREPLDEEDQASNTCKPRRPLAAPVSTAPRRTPPNSAVSPFRGAAAHRRAAHRVVAAPHRRHRRVSGDAPPIAPPRGKPSRLGPSRRHAPLLCSVVSER